jgi:NAD(P)-dependent dehydrogenase (short-subunit alcohol dehydrogenase family)
LVTGSTDGVGRLVARWLADQGARLLIHGRDRYRGKQIVDEIAAAGRHLRLAALGSGDSRALFDVRNRCAPTGHLDSVAHHSPKYGASERRDIG